MKRFLKQLFGSTSLEKRTVSSANGARPRLAVEGLEDRTVPSTLQILNNVLTYDAGAAVSNNVSVSYDANTNFYTLSDAGEKITVVGPLANFAGGNGTNAVTFSAISVPAAMQFNLGDRNDLLTVANVAPSMASVSVSAGDGNDTIDVGRFGSGVLSGIQAAVSVDGGLGTDSVRVNDNNGVLGFYTITDSQVSRSGGPTVNYGGAEILAVNGGFASDTFNVQSTAAVTRTTINGGAGGDTFSVGNAALTLDDIKGTLTLNGDDQGSIIGDTVAFLDQGNTAGHSYTLRDTLLARSGSATVLYSGMEGLTINAGSANDSISVVSTAAATPVVLNLGAGNDGVNLGTTAVSMASILSTVSVNGDAGTDVLNLNDQANTSVAFYGVSANSVQRNFSQVNYGGVETLNLNAGSANDFVAVSSTLAGTSVTVRGGAGDDTVNVGNASQSLDDIRGTLTVDGQTGTMDQLNLNDQGDNEFHSYTVTATSVVRDGAAQINYLNQENLVINAGAPPVIFFTTSLTNATSNTFAVRATAAGTTTTLNLGDYYDVVNVGSAANSLDGIQGALNVVGGGYLSLNDQGDTNANSYTVTANTVSRAGAAPISYNQGSYAYLGSLTINAGALADTVAVQSANIPTVLNLGNGNDTVTLGNGPAVGITQIDGVAVHGQGGTDAVVINDQRDVPILARSDYQVYSTAVYQHSGLHDFGLGYDTVESVTINAGAGDDSFVLRSTPAGTQFAVNGGAGNDTFKFPIPNIVNGVLESLAGPVVVDGQEGTDTLDYTALATGVRVNLLLGTATGLAGVVGVENVYGSQGNDILIGNDANNVLAGGAGRDIIVGGLGSDLIFGDAGDDILIGDSTAYDQNMTAFENIMREWGRTDLTGTAQQQFDLRRFHLILPSFGGSLSNGQSLDSSAVYSDGVADTVDGGADLNWIL